MPIGIFKQYQLDESVSKERLNVVSFNFIQTLKIHSGSKQYKPDRTPRSVASDLVLHCLTMSHQKKSSLI